MSTTSSTLYNRRSFLECSGKLAIGYSLLNGYTAYSEKLNTGNTKLIKIRRTNSDFEREPLIRPFGFKGGYMTECWQSASLLESDSGIKKIGLCTQNALYSDSNVYFNHSEAGGNALMFALTDYALKLVEKTPFQNPIELMEKIFPQVYEYGQAITGIKLLNKIFVLNSLISVDNAAWLVYAQENGYKTFDEFIPAPFKKALSTHHTKVAVIYLCSYAYPIEELKKAVENGYFVIKVKIGQPGTQEQMLEKDIARFKQVHDALKDYRTLQTKSGKLVYALDANGRYEKKETLLKFLDAAKKTGAYDQILFIEEPVTEENEEFMGDLEIRVGADESAHDYEGAVRRIQMGYKALVLKGIAKTLSMSMKMAGFAYEKGIPCICADLTVSPLLVDWHKNLACRLSPFPGLNMGLLETNGNLNYKNWEQMKSYHPYGNASWTKVDKGVFNLDTEFYSKSGGIFEPLPHYMGLLKEKE